MSIVIDTRVTEELIKLVPVLVGALIALSGAGVKYFVDKRDRRKQIRRDKLESLMHLAYQLKRWTSTVDDRYVFERSQDNIPLPTEELTVIASLYFPDLNDSVNAVVLSAKKYQKLAMETGKYRADNQGKFPENFAATAGDRYEELLNAIEELTKKAKVISKGLL